MAKIEYPKNDYLQVRFKLIDPISGSKLEVVFDHVKTVKFRERATVIDTNLPRLLIITVPQGTLRLLPEWLVSIWPPSKKYHSAQFDPEGYYISFSFETTMIDDLDIRIISGGKK